MWVVSSDRHITARGTDRFSETVVRNTWSRESAETRPSQCSKRHRLFSMTLLCFRESVLTDTIQQEAKFVCFFIMFLCLKVSALRDIMKQETDFFSMVIHVSKSLYGLTQRSKRHRLLLHYGYANSHERCTEMIKPGMKIIEQCIGVRNWCR